MATQIKTISDGSIIEFDSGSFDEWCVYLKRNGENRIAPRDVQYFAELQGLAKKYTSKKLYDDFLRIYSATDSKINEQVLNRITQISKDYGEDEIIVDIWLTVLYAGMVAEENKKYAILNPTCKHTSIKSCLTA